MLPRRSDDRTYLARPNFQLPSLCCQLSFTEELVTDAKADNHDMNAVLVDASIS
jgi:hypothetical protein